jgi:hypothetical protein
MCLIAEMSSFGVISSQSARPVAMSPFRDLPD